MKVYSFEKLDVWQVGRAFIKKIYSITEEFPSGEKYGLTSQLRRASISICSNLAEGSSRISNKDQAHFTHLAYNSLMEMLNQLIISVDLGFLSQENLSDLRMDVENLSNKLNAFRKSQLNN